ncbi:MAG TPA: acyl carrier protein [Longimicrobiales bacterium]
MTREAFVRETTAWINRRIAPPGVTIRSDTPLFEGGLIDSLRVLRLIAWTEKAIGRRIPDEQIRMDHFRDVECIARTFLEA